MIKCNIELIIVRSDYCTFSSVALFVVRNIFKSTTNSSDSFRVSDENTGIQISRSENVNSNHSYFAKTAMQCF